MMFAFCSKGISYAARLMLLAMHLVHAYDPPAAAALICICNLAACCGMAQCSIYIHHSPRYVRSTVNLRLALSTAGTWPRHVCHQLLRCMLGYACLIVMSPALSGA
jgi:hypothetical protein